MLVVCAIVWSVQNILSSLATPRQGGCPSPLEYIIIRSIYKIPDLNAHSKTLSYEKKLETYKNLTWMIASAEKLPIPENTFDFYTISFGLRNTKSLDKALSEAYRVLKPGGRYLCLEFSKIQNSGLDFIYKNYSKLLPSIGKYIIGEKAPYEYLVKSIENFLNQDELIDLMKKKGFQKCKYRNLSGGIVSIHSGWKI